jgi:hypothetical protein
VPCRAPAFAKRQAGAYSVVPMSATGAARGRTAAASAMAPPATLVVYHAVTRTFFFADDVVFLFDARNVGPLEFIVTPYGGHVALLREAVIVVLERLAGPRPGPFFTLVLATHVLNAVLLVLALVAFTGRRAIAAFCGVLWGAGPVVAGGLNWFAVYGQVMVATAFLLVVWRAAVLRARGTTPGTGTVLAGALVVFLGALSFGTGLAVAAMYPVFVMVLFPRLSWRARLAACAPAVLVPLAYDGIYRLHAMLSDRWVPAPPPLRAVLPAWRTVGRLLLHLVAHGTAALLAGFLAPLPLAPDVEVRIAAVALPLGVAAIVAGRRGFGRPALAVALVVLAAYGLISAGRAPFLGMYGKVTLPEVGQLPRYAYFGTLGLALLLGLALAAAAAGAWVARLGAGVLVVWLAAQATAWARSGWRPDTRQYIRAQTERVLHAIDAAALAAPPGTTVYLPNETYPGVGPMFAWRRDLFPGWVGVFVAFRAGEDVAGRPVRFVERDPGVRALLARHPDRRVARLVVAPDAVPADARQGSAAAGPTANSR